jgi:membrane protease YdiL (CAAX protease family)
MLVMQVLLVGIIGGIWLVEDWSPSDVGVTTIRSPIVSWLVGVWCYVPFLVVYSWVIRLCRLEQRLTEDAFEWIRVRWPRDRIQKRLLLFSACVLNPITEEVLFRGILVYNLGHVLGDVRIAMAIGLTFSLLVHLYQGWLAMPGQLLFHAMAILLLFSPFGLIGCIGFHFAGDLWPMWSTQRLFQAWVERQRQRRLERRPAGGVEAAAAFCGQVRGTD